MMVLASAIASRTIEKTTQPQFHDAPNAESLQIPLCLSRRSEKFRRSTQSLHVRDPLCTSGNRALRYQMVLYHSLAP